MVNPLLMWFVQGWILRRYSPGEDDPVTGEPGATAWNEHVGRGVLQEPSWAGQEEVTSLSALDERLVMFDPPVEVSAADEFFSPEGHCWQAIRDGRLRGIPGKTPEYVAVRVRRAKEKDR